MNTSQRFPLDDLFSRNISLESTDDRIPYQLESLHCSKEYNTDEEYFDETNRPKCTTALANFCSFIIFNGLQLQKLHLDNFLISTNELLFMLNHLKQLKNLFLSLAHIHEYSANFGSVTNQPLEKLTKLTIANNFMMKPAKAHFISILLEKSPNLTCVVLPYGHFDSSILSWLDKFNKKLKVLVDGVGLISSEIITYKKFDKLETLTIVRGLYTTNNQFYDVLDNIIQVLQINWSVSKLQFHASCIGGNEMVDEEQIEIFIQNLAQCSYLEELALLCFDDKCLYRIFKNKIVRSLRRITWRNLKRIALKNRNGQQTTITMPFDNDIDTDEEDVDVNYSLESTESDRSFNGGDSNEDLAVECEE